MHFAYPPRKSSNPPPFKARSSRIPPVLRRSRLKVIAAGALVFFGFIYLLSGAFKSPSGPRPPSGDPPAVIVTVLDEDNFSNKYLASIRDNRKQYAQLHGRLSLILLCAAHANSSGYRLRGDVRKGGRLRSERISIIMEQSGVTEACDDKVSRSQMVLVSRSRRLHHGPGDVSRESGVEVGQA